MIKCMVEKHNLSQCNDARSPYRSGLKIDRIEHDGKDLSTKEKLVREYQSIVGSINWLTINTRPNINTVYSLLSQFNLNPSQGHLDTAKYVLRYLKHKSSHGIWFRQGENQLHGSVAIPGHLKDEELMIFTDSNWGPQDASKPRPKKLERLQWKNSSLFNDFISPVWGVPCTGGCIVKREEAEVPVSRKLNQ